MNLTFLQFIQCVCTILIVQTAIWYDECNDACTMHIIRHFYSGGKWMDEKFHAFYNFFFIIVVVANKSVWILSFCNRFTEGNNFNQQPWYDRYGFLRCYRNEYMNNGYMRVAYYGLVHFILSSSVIRFE